MKGFKEYINEAASPGIQMENAIIAVWNGQEIPSDITDKRITQENVEKIVAELKSKGESGKASSLGASTMPVTKEWSTYWPEGKVPGGTKTPKTDIVIGSDKISLKTGQAAQLMSGGRNEARATFYAAANQLKGVDKKVSDTLRKGFDQLSPAGVTKGNLRAAIKSGKDELVKQADAVHKDLMRELTKVFSTNQSFRDAFAYEAMSGDVKFGGNDGACSSFLVVTWDGSKIHHVPVNDKAYVSSIAKKMKVSVRFKSGSEKKVIDGKKQKTGNYRYWSVVGLIVDKLQEDIDDIPEYALTEGVIADIFNKAKSFIKSIIMKIISWVKKSYKNLMDFLQVEPLVSFDNNIKF